MIDLRKYTSYGRLKIQIENLHKIIETTNKELRELKDLVHQILTHKEKLEYRGYSPTKLTLSPYYWSELCMYANFNSMREYKKVPEGVLTSFSGMDIIVDSKIEGWYIK